MSLMLRRRWWSRPGIGLDESHEDRVRELLSLTKVYGFALWEDGFTRLNSLYNVGKLSYFSGHSGSQHEH